MNAFDLIFYSILVPFLIWFIRTLAVYSGMKPDSEQRQKLKKPMRGMLIAAGILLCCGIYCIAFEGISNFVFYLISMTILAGIPLTLLSFFILYLVKWRRTPQDSPERTAYKRKMCIFGIIFGILAITYIAFIIWFAIGIAHM